MSMTSLSEIRLIVANSASENNIKYSNEMENNQKYYSIRISLIKTLKTYIKKYYQFPDKYNVLYLSITYLDIILSKNRISLSHDKNLKYLCLCCFLLSLKFIGNYNYSKKIIFNFCKNYKQEYKIFEIQCLMLLEHNLSYTTAYDFLSMITIKESKNFLALCNYYLYQICEDKIYLFYPPFYIAIAIFQMAKNNTNNIIRNHYDKYFKDERVKLLIKKFNDIINPSIINDIIGDNNDIFDANNYYNDINKEISNSNINIFTNNNIHNNIVIINNYSKNNEYNDESYISSNTFYEENNTPRKIVKISTNDFDKSYAGKDNIHLSGKSNNFLSRSQRINKLNSYNINYNLLNRISLKQNKKNSEYEITSYKKMNNNNENNNNTFFTLYKKNYKNNTLQIKKNLFNSNKIKNFFSYNYFNDNNPKMKEKTDKKENENSKERRKRNIINNKSSLNFQLVSGLSKDKLLKLSRNISKTILKTSADDKG